MPRARGINGTIRPQSSLSEHVAREIQRDYATSRRPVSRRGPIGAGARRIKTFVIATAGGVKRVTVATGRQGARVGGQLKRSVTSFTRSLSDPSRRPKTSASRSSNRMFKFGGLDSMFVIGRRKARSLKISDPILIPEFSEMSPFFPATGTAESAAAPEVNATSSIDDLLRAYGVHAGQTSSYMPPPPARAIFPPGHRHSSGRVHVRARPRPARPVSRGSSKPVPGSRPQSRDSSHGNAPSVRQPSGHYSVHSYASGSALGLSTLQEEMEEQPPPCTSTIAQLRCISDPTMPEVRTRIATVEVASRGTQTDASPPMHTSTAASPIDPSVNDIFRSGNERRPRHRERTSATPIEPRSQEPSLPSFPIKPISSGVLFNTPNYATPTSIQNGYEVAPDDNHPVHLHEEPITESLDQFYRARQREIERKNSLGSGEMCRETSPPDSGMRGRPPLRRQMESMSSTSAKQVDRRVRVESLSSETGEEGIPARKKSFDEFQREEPLFRDNKGKSPEQPDHHRYRLQRLQESSPKPEFTASISTQNYPPTPRNSISSPTGAATRNPLEHTPPTPRNSFSSSPSDAIRDPKYYPPTPRNSTSSASGEVPPPRHGPTSHHSAPPAIHKTGGPLSLTADRYRGAKTTSTISTCPPPTTRHRSHGGYSVDTTVSEESGSDIATVMRRDSFGQIWHSPLLSKDHENYWRGMHVE
jgi:hypothetical protein